MRTRIPVAIFVDHFSPGGTQRQMIELLERLDRRRFRVHPVCFHTIGAWFPRVARLDEEVAVFPIRGFRRASTARQLVAFARWCRATGIQVLQTCELYSNIFGLPGAALSSVPVRIGSRRGFVETPGLQRVQKVAYAAAHRIVANSLAAAARLRAEGIPGQKVTLIPNGIDPTIFPRRTYAERPRRIATVACLREEKRLDVLIEASARVLARYPDAEFLIAGDGPCRDELLELARRAGVVDRVRFLGHRDDVPGFLADADVFVLPSRSDASPNSIIEAMASGLPVIASAVGGIPEIVDHDKTGWLVPSGDPDALANAVLEMLAAPGRAADFGRAGRLKTERVYSFDRMVERFEALYLRELGDRRALQPGRQVA